MEDRWKGGRKDRRKREREREGERLKDGTYLRRLYECTKTHKSIIQHSLIDIRIQIPNEQIRTDIQLFPITRCLPSLITSASVLMSRTKREETHLVDTNGFTVKFDLIHDFTRIIRVLLGQELAKPISLMSH